MATFVLTDASVTINSVDLSDRVKSVSIDYFAEQQDDTTMGAGTRTMIPGLLDYTIECEMVQDFAVSNVDATMFPLVGAVAFPIAIRPTSGAIAATNPEYQGNVIIENYPPLGNTVGEIATTTLRFRPSGASPTLLRDVTP
jgi:hypothetical protein